MDDAEIARLRAENEHLRAVVKAYDDVREHLMENREHTTSYVYANMRLAKVRTAFRAWSDGQILARTGLVIPEDRSTESGHGSDVSTLHLGVLTLLWRP